MVVLMQIRLGPHHHASRKKQTLSGAEGKHEFPPFTEPVIAEASRQAEWEFGVQPEEWPVPDQPETV